jgi:hypothetical protein
VRETPPVPDATAAELRAIRRELELLRRDVQQLIANQPDHAHTHAAPTPPKQIQLPPPKPTPPPRE